MAPSAHEWITAYAEALGTSPPSEAEVEQLLALAGVAAHTSERAAAPISCFLVGRAGADAASAHAAALAVAEALGGEGH